MWATKRAIGAVAALVILTIAGPATGTAAATRPTPEPVGTSGCGSPPPASGVRSVPVDPDDPFAGAGPSRSYILDVPPGYQADTPTPIVFAFHGLGGSGSRFRAYSGLVGTMGDESILVFPDAIGPIPMWQLEHDPLFFDAMLEELSRQLCINVARVFATGHSMGGIFSNQLGCVRGDVLRAIAPVAGGGPIGNMDCVGRVNVWLAHGDPDPIVPLSAGERSRDFWIERNGCSTSTRTRGPGVGYEGCAAGGEIRWNVHNQGHSFPNFAAEGIATFFETRK